jgi:hypothetical protein
MSLDRNARLSPRQRAHKVAARTLIEAVGGVEPSAMHCRLGKSQLSDCCNPNVAAFMPSDAIADLEAVAGDPSYTRFLATLGGHELLRLPDPAAPETVFSALIGRLAKETGEITAGVCEDLVTGNDVSPAEARQRLKDADDMVRAAVELRAALQQRADQDSS